MVNIKKYNPNSFITWNKHPEPKTAPTTDISFRNTGNVHTITDICMYLCKKCVVNYFEGK